MEVLKFASQNFSLSLSLEMKEKKTRQNVHVYKTLY